MVKNMNYKKLLFITTFTIFSIAINYCCSYLAGLIAFPLYLDSIMTIAVTALCGFVPGVICAFCSNFLLFIFANTGILFSLCHISTAVVAHLVFNAEKKKNLASGNTHFSYTTENFMWIGFFAALTNSLFGDSISYFFYSANTTIPQVDNAVQGIFVATKNLTFAAYFGGTVTNIIDKVCSATFCLFVYRFANWIRKRM